MKRASVILFMTALLVSSFAYAESSYNTSDQCGGYVQKMERERSRLNNFETEVIAPMVMEAQRLKKNINFRIKRPREIENRNAQLEAEIKKLEIDIKANDKKIELLTKEAETLEAQGREVAARKKRKKIGELERQNINKTTGIERNFGKIDGFNEELQEIKSSKPPLPRMEEELAQLEMQIEDQEQLKGELMENVSFFESAAGMCRDYQQLRMECRRN